MTGLSRPAPSASVSVAPSHPSDAPVPLFTTGVIVAGIVVLFILAIAAQIIRGKNL